MIYNINFLISGIIFLLVIMYYFMTNRTMDFGHNQTFLWLLLVSILNLCFDLICTALISWQIPRLSGLTELCIVTLYILQMLVPSLLLYHIMAQFSFRPKYKYMWIISGSLPVLMLLLLIVNHWTGYFFTVSDSGVYSRGPLYMLMYVFAGIYLLASAVCSKIHEAELSSAKTRAIYELVAIAGIFVIIQSFNKDVLVSGFGISIGITILFFTLDNPYHYTDSLTNAYDIRYFKDRCQNRIDRNKNFNILAVKLSQLKHVNLIMGTETGNELLVAASELLRSGSKKNLVFRMSGNQLVVMSFSQDEHIKLCERAEYFFSKPVELNSKELAAPAVICSIKQAQKLENSDDLLAYVDYLLRNSKSGNGCSFAEDGPETLKGFRKNQEIESYLYTALEKDLFTVAYQPIYSVEKKKFNGIEVLSRLHHPDLGWIPPDIFITMAERSGQIAKLGLLQLRKVCRFLSENPGIVKNIENVKINLSPAELAKNDYSELILNMIKEYELPVSLFQFEITETVATEYSEILDQLIERFVKVGIKFCMDDFGSGYSNLNAVMKLPFSVIKIDRSMLFGICDNERIAALYRSAIDTFHNLGYQVVSEGVETKEEVQLVTKWGTDMIQGYYYSRPVSGDEIVKLLET